VLDPDKNGHLAGGLATLIDPSCGASALYRPFAVVPAQKSAKSAARAEWLILIS
jgi:hypothetical protein